MATSWSLAADVERRVVGNLVLEDVPEIPGDVADRLRRYQNTRSASFQGWISGGEGVVVRTRFAETAQLHRVERPGGARRQLTFFDEPVGGAALSPASPSLLFTRDVGGSEFYQVFHLDLRSGDYRMLTDGESRNGATVWADDGRRFAFYSTRRNGRDWDVYVADTERPGEAQRVVSQGGTWLPIEFSPDGRRLLVEKYVSANESELYIAEVESRELQRINPSAGRVSYGVATWARDGSGIFLTSDQGGEFRRLQRYDLRTRRLRVLSGDIDWNVDEIDVAADGATLAFTVNEDGLGALYLLDTSSLEHRRVPGVPAGQIYNVEFDPAGERLAMVLNTPRTPGDIFVLDLPSGEIERWTYSEVGGLATDDFAVPELVRYPTFDEVDGEPRQIPAFYYRPRGDGPFPVIVRIHGGPEGQHVPRFSPLTQYYVGELGAAVVAPNVRGSAGYGKSFLLLDNGLRREDSVRDIGALLDWIAEQPELDASRVAVVGGSYGGYMVLASLMHFDERLSCGIDVVGISNFVTFLENTQDYRRDLRRAEYGDERDGEMREFLERISPTNNAERITSPLFVAQGLNDPRVPASESEQMVAEIRANGGDVWYMLAKDEGHGFRKKANRDFYYGAAVTFLDRCLADDAAGAEAAGPRKVADEVADASG